jgi:DNA repair ATPase RecN
VPICVAAPSPVPVCEPPPKVPPDPTDMATRRLLAYHDQIRQMQNPDLAKELARLGDTGNNPQAAVQAAMVMGQTRNTADTSRAVALLEPVVRSTSPDAAPVQPLARLLLARYIEQRRVDEQIERQGQQLRENQRNLQQLNEKLEALKAIERSLNKRPAAPPAASSPTPAPAPAAKP